jgi:NAD(P)-dependent dehydrogenase (short-subunit alcohol dehydrogenase family)
LTSVEQLHVVVTGGGRGIGAAIAQAMSRAGASVTVLGRDIGRLEAMVAAGDAARLAVADVTDEAGLRAAVAGIAVAGGPIEVLINNAGAASSAPFLKTPLADYQRMLSINLLGPVIAAQAVLPSMVERRFGRIINIASTASLKGYAYVSAYVAAKHGLLGFTRALALETATKGVTVNAICPGFTDTDLVAASVDKIVSATGRSVEEARAELASGNPQRRLIAPADVAQAALFLAGREASAMTGLALPVAGGEI